MKTLFKKRGIALLLAALFLLLMGSFAGMVPTDEVIIADAAGAYDYTVESYSVEMDVGKSCSVRTTEIIRVRFSGYSSHGIIRDFPLGGGMTYSDFKASCDSADFSPYFQTDSSDVLSWYLRGEGIVAGQERIYTLRYTVHARLVGGALPLDVLGYGMQSDIGEFSAAIHLPAAAEKISVYSGRRGTSSDEIGIGSLLVEQDGGKTVAFTVEDLSATIADANGIRNAPGITLNFSLPKGALRSRLLDMGTTVSLIASVLVLAAAAFILAFGCKKPLMTRTVNLTAPEEMDPLLMGKLIDNKIDSEDLGSLVFYLAAKGYLDIDLSGDEEDPILIKKGELPEDAPAHLALFFQGLFMSGDEVLLSSLTNSFYSTANAVKTAVSAAAGHNYETRGKVFCGVFALLSLLLGALPLVCSLFSVGRGYLYFSALIFTALAFAGGAGFSCVASIRAPKWGKKAVWFRLAGLLPGIAFAVMSLLAPCASFTPVAVCILIAAATLLGVFAGFTVIPTEKYASRLGHILGFRDFILYTEKDKIEEMLKENPELYYDVLPYAQVLGVTDAWTKKVAALDLAPPRYVRYGSADFVFDVIHWNFTFRTLTLGMSRTFLSRPSSTVGGRGGFGGGGGSFGGFGGGGFGGGGMRGC